MKLLARFVLLLLIGLPSFAFSQTSAILPDYALIAHTTVLDLAQGKWSAVETRFDARMKAALPKAKLAAVWEQVTAQAGAFKRIDEVNLGSHAGYHIAMVACIFANADLNAKVVIDLTGRIAGLFFIPPPAPAAASGKQPDYSAIGSATVSEISLGQWQAVEARFDQRMKAALPQGKLSSVWQQVIGQAGAFQLITGVTLGEESGYHVAMVHCAFANARLDAKIVMDSAGRIAGLFFVPPA